MQSTAALNVFQQITTFNKKIDNEPFWLLMVECHIELRVILTWTQYRGPLLHPLLGQLCHGTCMMLENQSTIALISLGQRPGGTAICLSCAEYISANVVWGPDVVNEHCFSFESIVRQKHENNINLIQKTSVQTIDMHQMHMSTGNAST